MTSTVSLTGTPTGPRIGAEIAGVDLHHPVGHATADQLREALRIHKVLVLRGATLSPDQHVAAVRIFGEPFDHPTGRRHPDNPLVYPYRVEHAGKASH
ncbi:TauD/TfdA dioxygenase family protein [Pseudonocardia aurantiaca]|uniref:TauD/TfdA dioxygenase family protein n=1 Tax=Pseudonocardia aurantiaca TaxID=75290 RepID=A0ABW4G0E3_9PSEU